MEPLPPHNILRDYVMSCGRRYWPRGEERIARLPAWSTTHEITSPLRYVEFEVPAWAKDLGVDGKLLLPECCLKTSSAKMPADVDWYTAAFLMLSCWDEQVWEASQGPAHSYSMRLVGLDSRVWDRAWVNRIFLFLRRWAARLDDLEEVAALGALPNAKIEMTHDLDALNKTFAIRLKGTAFALFNAFRSLRKREWAAAARKLGDAWRFMFSQPSYFDAFDKLLQLSKARGVYGTIHVYAGRPPALGLTRLLLDPGYRIDAHAKGREILRRALSEGFAVGLHPSFDSWGSGNELTQEKLRLERALKSQVTQVRQHWLRFSFAQTWRAQSDAGFTRDCTLGFNDRSGFRNGAALEIQPWRQGDDAPLSISSLPLVIMDSQVYDYRPMAPQERRAAMARWIDEIRFVRGQASVLWHPHTLSADYGWEDGFRELLALMADPASPPTAPR